MHLRGIEQLVSEPMLARAAQAAADDVAVGGADHQAAGHLQQVCSRVFLKPAPELIGAAQQRHVGGMFEISEPDHPRSAVTRSLGVTRLELFKAEHPFAARGNMRGSGAAHAAEADDDDVEHKRYGAIAASMPEEESNLIFVMISTNVPL